MNGSSNEETYTNRRVQPFTVKSLYVGKDALTIQTTDSTRFSIPLTEETKQIHVGGTYSLELKDVNDIGGVLTVEGVYLLRRSDQHFERQRVQFLAEAARHRREWVEANREDWQSRENALPEWIRARMERFHAAGGEYFEVEGWGYELTICELAVIYERNGLVDDAEVTQFASLYGTSGNQHGCALALARHKDQAVAFPAGLSPLTGDADYSAGARAMDRETAVADSSGSDTQSIKTWDNDEQVAVAWGTHDPGKAVQAYAAEHFGLFFEPDKLPDFANGVKQWARPDLIDLERWPDEAISNQPVEGWVPILSWGW